MTGPREMPALTALRGVAALLVFLYHFAPKGLPFAGAVVAGQGHVGVTVFFVLSGFLITVRYYPQFARGEHRWGAYFIKRVARILPLYYAVLALTHLLSTGFVPHDSVLLPEWTLTQALFAPGPDSLTVPTSWSLTVEECFYATAPLLFLGLAAAGRRLGKVAGALALMTAVALALHLAGSLLVWLLPSGGGAPAFLSEEPLLRYYTMFGRFPDFALGVGAGLLFLSGRVEAVWRGRRASLIASLGAAAASALVFTGQAGMMRGGADPTAHWAWNLLVAAGSAVLVLALTCGQAPLARLLALGPAVYLGRISYALYLIQLTPLGNGLLQRFLPAASLLDVAVLYVGMNAVSALLFELVEEPARETILALWRTPSGAALPAAATSRGRALSVAIVFGALAVQHAVWTLGALPPVDEARVVRALGPGSPDVVQAQVAVATPDGREPRLRLPAVWQQGPEAERRAPRALLVFVDGRRVPFLGARLPEGPETAAYFRGRRSGHLSLVIAEPAAVTVVNHAPLIALELAWSRLAEAPAVALGPPLLLALLGLVAYGAGRRRVWAPRTCLALAALLIVGWVAFGIHLRPWAPLVLLLELCAVLWLLVSRRAAEAAGGEVAVEG